MFKEKIHLKDFHNESKEDIIKTGIYTIEFINKPGIYYVGSATRSNKKFGKSNLGFYARWREHIFKLHNGVHYNKKLQNNFNKYGKENIRFEIIEFCEPVICFGIEQYWLNVLNSYQNGYNLACVVDKHSIGHTYTPERRKQMSDRMLGEKNPNYKKKHNTDEINTIKISLSKPILQYDYDGYFLNRWESSAIASKELNIDGGNISKCCNKKQLTYKKCFWFFEDDNNIDEYILNTVKRKKDSYVERVENLNYKNPIKKVYQYDLDYNFIKEWESIKDATISIGGTFGNITSVCKGRSKSYRNFIWRYEKV